MPGVPLLPNSPELRALRGKDPVQGWVSLFSRRDPDRAKRYQYALHLFLGYPDPGGGRPAWASSYLRRSPRTLREYRFAVAEFFEFIARWKGKVTPPHEVTRKDAFDYAEWLLNRGKEGTEYARFQFSLDVERLRDGDRDDDLAVYEAIRDGAKSFDLIARSLPLATRRRWPRGPGEPPGFPVDAAWLNDRLLTLMKEKLVVRSPSYEMLREDQPLAGKDADHPVDPNIYTYALRPLAPCARATVSKRLSALSSFWSVMQKGENSAEKPLLQYNVFEDALEASCKGLRQEKRAASLGKRPTAELILRVMDAAAGPKLVDHRNVALLWFLLLTGARIEEALGLRRSEPATETDRKTYPGWLELSAEPPVAVLRRKGGRMQRIAMPPTALVALKAFWAELEKRAPSGTSPNDPVYRYRLLAGERDAPLFPSLFLWGKNRAVVMEDKYGRWSYKKALGQPAVAMLLGRLADKAGLTMQERRKVHPHGFRHIAAEGMVAGGKPIREVQAILGHASVTTTEGYLPSEMDDVRVSGENEIMDWLSRKGARVKRPGEPATPVTPVTPITIKTYGREVQEEERQAARPQARPEAVEAVFEELDEEMPAAECRVVWIDPECPPRPPGLPEGAPAGPPAPKLLPAAPSAPGRVSGVGEGSPPSPLRPYEEMAAGRKPGDLTWSGRPQAAFIERHYPELPLRVGIGRDSLLPWWNKDAPLPWPVLAPVQAYPEVKTTGFVAALEALYDEWSTESPSKALALSLWYFYLGSVTAGIEGKMDGAYSWVSFNALGQVGEDLRAHDNDWLLAWFRNNAPLFAVAQRRFAAIPKPYPGEEPDAYWERIQADARVGSLIPTTPEIPVWFYEDDPVRTIYDRDPAEWKAFASWLGRLTGETESQRRKAERAEQSDYVERSTEHEEARAKGLLEQFYAYLDDWVKAGPSEKRGLADQMERLRKAISDSFGITVPTDPPKGNVSDRIERLLRKVFPHRPPPVRRNVLGDARMFQPAAFRIDDKEKTIRHDPAFKKKFAAEHFKKDSECVMRRVARALWEKARPVVYLQAKRKLTEAEEQRELFITLLAMMSYVVPCPPDIEAALLRAGVKAARPSDIAAAVEDRIVAIAKGADVETEIDEIALDILETYLEQVPDISPDVASALAIQQARRERRRTQTEAEGKEKAAARKKKLEPNLRRVLPHPLHLVAASFWPV